MRRPPPSAHAASRPLTLGFFDPIYTVQPAISELWLQHSADAGSDIVKFDAGWPAPTRPASPRDPADPAYDFSQTDRVLRAARARGLDVLLVFSKAPRWAEGPGRRATAPAGSWRPDPSAVGDYGAALARRYSGSYPDPLTPGAALPRVKAFQLWNEPNLALYLNPQWSGSRPRSPELYRAMLNAFYAGVKSASPSALVVTAGTGPFGDPASGGRRMMPARFWRTLLCQKQLRGRLKPAACPRPARFDVLAHHPYPGASPRWKELYADDVSINGMAKLTRILNAAQRTGRVLPRGKPKRVWVTEVSYDSAPPDRNGVPLARHARWLQETLFLLWRRGVDTITWFRIVDQLPLPSYGETNQSGLFRVGGQVKPAARAFAFPLVAERVAGSRRLRVWGRSPVAGRVTIERAAGGRWVAIKRVSVRRHGTFLTRVLRAPGVNRLRARAGRETQPDVGRGLTLDV